MHVSILGHGMLVNKTLDTHVQNRSSRLDRYLPGAEELRVEFKRVSAKEEAPKTVQLTVKRKRAILRVEEHHTDPFTAFDTALDTLYQRIARYKGRRGDRKRSGHVYDEELQGAEAVPIDAVEDGPDEKVVRVKSFSVVPMSVEEALEQMELLGHDFYMFMDGSDSTTKVVYRRKIGDYGLLQPER